MSKRKNKMILEPYNIEIIDKRKWREYKYNQHISDFGSLDCTKWIRVHFKEGWWHDGYYINKVIFHTGNITESSKYIFLESKNGRYYA